jgi:hypothetical protein
LPQRGNMFVGSRPCPHTVDNIRPLRGRGIEVAQFYKHSTPMEPFRRVEGVKESLEQQAFRVPALAGGFRSRVAAV